MSSYVRDRAIGERIREARRKRGISQRELAGALDLSTIAVSQFELGTLAVPKQRFAQVASALGVTVADLLDGLPMTDLTDEETALVRALRALPAEGRAYIGRLMAGLASGEVAR